MEDYKNLEKWHFHNNEKDCNYLFDLVLKGIKTATSYLYLKESDLKPKSFYSILTNWDNSKEILLKTTKIYKTKFKNVTELHAQKEGEGDKTLAYYKKVHTDFFKNECKNHNLFFNKNTEIVCEEFKILKKSLN